MRYFALVIALLLFALPTLASAAPGGVKGSPADKGQGQSQGNGDPGAPAPPALPPPPAPPPDDPPLTPAQIADEQDNALDAVQSGRALPLSEISKGALARWGGRLIDVRLISAKGRLIYQLTLVSDGGTIARVLVDAKTATPLGAR